MRRYCVYVLANASGDIYVGQSGYSAIDRLEKHNAGKNVSSRAGRPWRLLYSLPCNSRKDAVGLESFIHDWIGRSALGRSRKGHDVGYVSLLKSIEGCPG